MSMSKIALSRPAKATLKAFSAVLLAGTVAGCSSELTRFSYYSALNDDQLTTASIKKPGSASLQPIGVGTQQFPGSYRQPSVPNNAAAVPAGSQVYPTAPAPNDPMYTASVPSAPTELYATPTATTTASVVRPPVIKQPLEAPKTTPLTERISNALSAKPKPTLENTVVEQAALPKQPIIRPMMAPETQTVTGTVVSATKKPRIIPMKPDPIVTGTVPASQQDPKGGWTTVGGTNVVIGEGETVYNLSRRYGVPAAEILNANGITDSRKVRAGQSLTIPVYVYTKAAPVSAPDNDPLTLSANSHKGSKTIFPNGSSAPIPSVRTEVAALAQPKPVTAPQQTQAPKVELAAAPKTPSASNGYTVVSGDTLTGIARKFGITVKDLQAANGLSSSNIGIGQKLVIPVATTSTPAVDRTVTASVPEKKPVTTVNRPTSLTETANAGNGVATPEKTGIDRLRWPAKGQIASSFGGKTDDGKRNDGLDILLPEGTPIKAAENGTVIYASNGLKGYGNTVLVRHGENLVTVYAHAKTLNVKRGDQVQRGQVIAHSGMTGTANRPKLHFEVREKATPKNPITYLE